MPIYEYICTRCNESFSLLQRVGSTEKDTSCPKCGSREIKKKLSLFSCVCSIDVGDATGGQTSVLNSSG